MAHFAKIDSKNVVENVVVVPDEQEHRGNEYLNEIGLEGTWIQTSYNNNLRNTFAGIGMIYLPDHDAFVSKKPYESWVLNSELKWEAPTPRPDEENEYIWDEDSQSWK